MEYQVAIDFKDLANQPLSEEEVELLKQILQSSHFSPKNFLSEYKSWDNMRTRCYNPKTPTFHKYYGGRGIKVCDRWLFGEDGFKPFVCFMMDMGPKPTPKHSLDRFPNNDGNYEPGNVRWATSKEQSANRRR
jgi:hypothetical protein